MLTIVKRSQDEILEWLRTEAGFITSLCHYQGRPIDLEPYQVAWLVAR